LLIANVHHGLVRLWDRLSDEYFHHTGFVAFWAARYTGYDDEFYDANVGHDLTETSILEWFTWKNGTPLSEAKRQSVLRHFVRTAG
jgi:hypothetical protein